MFRSIKNFLFVNTSTKQTIVKNSFWFALGTTVTKIARAVLIIYVARILGADDYGIFTYAMSLVGIAMIFADLGVTTILTRELSKDGSDKRAYLSTAFGVKIGFLFLSIALVAIFGPLVSKFAEAKSLLLLVATFVALESLRSFLYAVTRAQNKMQIEAGLSVVAEAVVIAVILILFLKNSSAHVLAEAFVFGNLLGLLSTVFFLRKSLGGLFSSFKSDLAKDIIRSSWPFAVMGVFGALMTNIDSVMLGFWNPPKVLGLYAAAQKPITLLYVLPGFLSISLFPFFSRLVEKARSDTYLAIEKSVRAASALALPIMLGGLVLAGPLMSVTFGPEYASATLTFQIFLLTLLVAFPGAVLSDVIVAENRQKVFIKSSAFGALTNVLFNFLLIPKYGIAGSAVATLLAQLVMNGIIYIQIRKNYKINILAGFGKLLPASLAMSVAAYLLASRSVPLLVIVPIAVVLYFGLLTLLKEEVVVAIGQSFSGR